MHSVTHSLGRVPPSGPIDHVLEQASEAQVWMWSDGLSWSYVKAYLRWHTGLIRVKRYSDELRGHCNAIACANYKQPVHTASHIYHFLLHYLVVLCCFVVH